MSKGKTANRTGRIPHPSGVYHRHTWMGNGWMPRAIRKANKSKGK